MIVKTGDTDTIRWRANADLTGATVRLIAKRSGSFDPVILISEITDASNGEVSHTLSGHLDAGTYDVELEATRDGKVFTFPSDGTATLVVRNDLEARL